VNDFVLNNANEITDIIALSNITRTTTSLTTTDLVLKTGALTPGSYLINTVVFNNTNLTVAFDQRLLTLGALSIKPVNANGTGYINENLSILTPDANITLTIPNGTRATLSDGTTSISNITSYAPTAFNSTLVGAASGSNLKFLGKNITLLPAGALFDPYILIRFNYSDADIPGGVSEDSLKVYWYNGTTGTWTSLTTQEHNKTGNYLIARVAHFSIFALLGTVTQTTPCSNCGSSSGSGGGGGGVVSAEPYENIARSETHDMSLVHDKPITYTFKLPELGIYEIDVIGKESENNVDLKIELLKGPTKMALISAPPGIVYKNMNIWAGSKRIKAGLIRFKVENTWIANNNIAKGDLVMIRWNGNEWTKLETSELNKDEKHTFYESKTPGFSSFAITVQKGGEVSASTPGPGVTDNARISTKSESEETVTAVPTKKSPGFGALGAVLIMAVFFFVMKRVDK
ncbi:MAG: PGF-pre-PGF domain-containing protein, partial [Candidatus Methanoperedens sp.]|nr:PGF-pre-PGF domain-containing protein [Candidatus Methanoperedens sp.]